jgi:hypothetical protein
MEIWIHVILTLESDGVSDLLRTSTALLPITCDGGPGAGLGVVVGKRFAGCSKHKWKLFNALHRDSASV